MNPDGSSSEPDATLAYGPAPSQMGELRLPRARGPHRVVIVVHGGFWRATYGLDGMVPVCTSLTNRGFATWNLEYRRLGEPGGGWPGTFEDVARGADFLRDVAAASDLDLERVVAVGHSAGGHLALWLAARHRIPSHHPLASASPLALSGAVCLGGVSDLRMAWDRHLSNGVVGDLMGGPPDTVADRYAAGSPIELLPLGLRQVVVHGTADRDVPFEIGRHYSETALGLGDPVELVELPRVGHMDLVDPRSAAWPHVERAIAHLFD